MRLLQIAHRLPWPPIDGGNKGVLGFVDAYARHPEVAQHTFACLCRHEDLRHVEEWKPAGVDVRVEPVDGRNRLGPFLANTLFSRDPYNMEKYRQASLAYRIESVIAQGAPDVVHFDGLHTAAYAAQVQAAAPEALRVLRCHNAEYMILERLALAERNPVKRSLISLQARRLKSYEARMLRHFDLVLPITDTDAQRFVDLDPGSADRLLVVPAGADIPAALPPEPPAGHGPVRLIHIAAMDWLPNQGGLRWLRDKVIPLLDRSGLDYHLDVIGKAMPEEFMAMNGPRVTVHGFVQDLAPFTRAAQLAVVPLQVGSGMRVKILDFWSMGIPVIGTAIAAEGLTDWPQPVVALADEPEDFANAIERLAGNPAERRSLRTAAFDKVSARYGWNGLVDGLIRKYQQMAAARSVASGTSRHAH